MAARLVEGEQDEEGDGELTDFQFMCITIILVIMMLALSQIAYQLSVIGGLLVR